MLLLKVIHYIRFQLLEGQGVPCEFGARGIGPGSGLDLGSDLSLGRGFICRLFDDRRGQAFYDAGPNASGFLAEQTHGRIPGAVVAV